MFNALKKFLRILGPSIITGAADDDPSGIATYSQMGVQFGYGGSDATFVKALAYLEHYYRRTGFFKASTYLNISLVALESRKLRQIQSS